MDYKEKYTKETGRKPYCYNAKGEIVQSASYGDGYVKWLEEQLSLCGVVSSKITVSVTYLKWHDSGHALLDDYSTKETKIVKVNDVDEINDMFTNIIKIKVVK